MPKTEGHIGPCPRLCAGVDLARGNPPARLSIYDGSPEKWAVQKTLALAASLNIFAISQLQIITQVTSPSSASYRYSQHPRL
jgi:hypothetical protein